VGYAEAIRTFSRLSVLRLAGIVAVGILSRVVRTGFAVLDKYLGDALYAAMVYEILRLLLRPRALAAWALAVMVAIELFQLTRIPAQLVASDHLAVRICGRLLGTQFGFLDLAAYAVGIGSLYLLDRRR